MGYQVRPDVDLKAVIAKRFEGRAQGLPTRAELGQIVRTSGQNLSYIVSGRRECSPELADRIVFLLGYPGNWPAREDIFTELNSASDRRLKTTRRSPGKT